VRDAMSGETARPSSAQSGAEIAFLPIDDARLSRSLEDVIARRVAFLTDYQNAAYARRYAELVERTRAAETTQVAESTALTAAVARYAFKLMAYKDEYEVARLYTSGEFRRRLEQQFEGDFKLHFHLAPPLLAKKDAQGHLVKREFGPWVFTVFKVIAKLRGLRGTPLDLFGYTEERRGERRLIAEYASRIDSLLRDLTAGKLDTAVAIASIPEHIRGYGHVKDAHLVAARAREAALLAEWYAPARELSAAA